MYSTLSRHSLDCPTLLYFFFFHDTATTEIYTLSLHDALPICPSRRACDWVSWQIYGNPRNSNVSATRPEDSALDLADRKSTRLNSQSHSDLVCRLLLEKKKKRKKNQKQHTKYHRKQKHTTIEH